jgi:hypothetical protein
LGFNWNGTFTKSQFARFRAYVENQLPLIDARIAHLQAERDRVGSLSFAYDSAGNPTSFAHDIPDTYCGKLFAAYEALGGDAEFDLQVRSQSQPVFLVPGDVNNPAQLMSNGEVVGVLGLSDAYSATVVQKIRRFVGEDLQRRREGLERKIRRALDYADQLNLEIAQLKALKGSAASPESMAAYFSTIDTLTTDPRYMAITDDSGNPDPHGKFAKAPVAGYVPGPKGATATTYERTPDGLVKPAK